jgi:FtsH-binding integral membrane protein
MLEGVMLLWFLLAALSLLFVAVDIRTTPESPVLKWGFVLLTAYTGVVGTFLYVLGCREPLPGLQNNTSPRQTLGSTMHCVAGDGVGILTGAVLASVLGLAGLTCVIEIYLVSSPLQLLLCVTCMLALVGLTAWDSQRVKDMYFESDGGDAAGRRALVGALALYLDANPVFLLLQLENLAASKRDD